MSVLYYPGNLLQRYSLIVDKVSKVVHRVNVKRKNRIFQQRRHFKPYHAGSRVLSRRHLKSCGLHVKKKLGSKILCDPVHPAP